MAAAVVANGQGGLLAVDTARLAAVSMWDPAWVGLTMADTVAWLHPDPAAASIPVHGRLSLAAGLDREAGDASVGLGVVVRDADGRPSEVAMGEVQDGATTLAADLPMCVDSPCTLVGFTVRQPIDRPSSNLSAALDLGDAVDAEGPVDLAAPGEAGWRTGVSATAVPIERGAEVVSAADERILLRVDVENGDAGVQVADHPAVLPVLQGSAVDTSASNRVSGLDGRFVPAESGGVGLLPRLGSNGTLADLRYALAATGASAAPMSYQVWLAEDAPPTLRADLESAGLVVVAEDSVDERLAALERTGVALALRLFVITALVALGLAAGTLLAHSFIMIRRRAYELAALTALGASRPLIIRSARREVLVLVVTGVLLGLVSGLVAAAVALPALLGGTGADAPPPWFGPAWLPVLGLTVVTLLLLAVIADISARATARRATPDLLRQVQE
jgi:hypothetical protein